MNAHVLPSRLLALSLTLTLLPLPSRAQPSPTAPNAAPSTAPTEAVAVNPGQPAPFPGILLPLPVASGLYKNLETCKAELAIEQQKCPALVNVERGACQKKLDATESAKTEQVDAYKKALTACELEATRQWYENPGLLLATGFVVGTVTAVSIVFALGQSLRLQ